MPGIFRFPLVLRFSAAALAIVFIQAFAADNPSKQAQQRFRQDMALCKNGQSNQDMLTCQREARNALAEARRGALAAPSADLQDNAKQRCSVHQGLDRTACEARMSGEGSVEGSVGNGGVLRKSVTVVPGT